MHNNLELCTECLGEGKVVLPSKAIETKMIQRKCRTCKGTGETPSIMNSAFLSDQEVFDRYE